MHKYAVGTKVWVRKVDAKADYIELYEQSLLDSWAPDLVCFVVHQHRSPHGLKGYGLQKESVPSIEDKVRALRESNNTYRNTNESLRRNMAWKNEQIENQAKTIKSIQEQNESLVKLKVQCMDTIHGMALDAVEHEKTIATLRESVDPSGTIANLQERISHVSDMLDVKSRESENYRTAYETLNESNTRLSKDYDKLQAEHKQVQSGYESAVTTGVERLRRIMELEKQLKAAKQDYNNLKAEVAQAQNISDSAFVSKVDELEQQLKTSQLKVISLEGEVQDWKNNYRIDDDENWVKFNNELKAAKERVAVLERTVEIWRSTHQTDWEESNKRLRTELDEAKRIIGKDKSQFDALRDLVVRRGETIDELEASIKELELALKVTVALLKG